MDWIECDDKLKMHDELLSISDTFKLRQFALNNLKSILHLVNDERLKLTAQTAKGILNGSTTEKELALAYDTADLVCEELEIEELSNDEISDNEENIEYYAALVTLWASYPSESAGVSKLESAQQSALHTAFYCFKIGGELMLSEQKSYLKKIGLK